MEFCLSACGCQQQAVLLQACNRQGLVSAPLYNEMSEAAVHALLMQLQSRLIFAASANLAALAKVKARGGLQLSRVVCMGSPPAPAVAEVPPFP